MGPPNNLKQKLDLFWANRKCSKVKSAKHEFCQLGRMNFSTIYLFIYLFIFISLFYFIFKSSIFFHSCKIKKLGEKNKVNGFSPTIADLRP
jgi:hypothetical protein